MTLVGSGIFIPGPGDGSPGSETLVGSGNAVPGGLECVFEYNGLFLNIRNNIDRYRITGIDGLGDADIRDTRDVNTEDDGETPYNSFYGGRTIVLTGQIQTYSVAKLRDMQQALRAAFSNIRKEYPLHFRTGDFNCDHVIYCKKISSISSAEQQGSLSVHRDFQITLRASNPRFLSYYQRTLDISPTVPTTGLTEIGTAENRGNYMATTVIRMYGPATSVSLVNDTTSQVLGFGPVEFGDYVDFDVDKKTLVNSVGTNQWNKLQDDSDYIFLAPGENNFFYMGDSPRIQIFWRDSWI